MFEQQKNSLGALDGFDSYWAFSFLKGESCEEQFESFNAVPPEWLLSWARQWRGIDIFTIDDIDPLIGEYLLVFDESSGEVWAGIHQGDDVAVFKKIPTTTANPDREVVSDFFLKELERIGDCIMYGNLTVESPEWIPREKMEAFLKDQMRNLNQTTLHGLKLEQWLTREFGED